MLKKSLLGLGMALILAMSFVTPVYTDQVDATATAMEDCGAYLSEWKPIDCGNSYYFATLVGGNTIQENDVILNGGYDYAYIFDHAAERPWGQVPNFINANGVWATPENQPSFPEGTQPALRITLVASSKVPPSRECYIDVVSLPGGVNPGNPPPKARKYLINADESDAGTYVGVVTPGWQQNEDGKYRYLKPDGTYVSSGWLKVNDQQYYTDGSGTMLTDTTTPDGYHVSSSGGETSYHPRWVQDDKGWRYVGKNGYYAASIWAQDTDGKWYYFNITAYMETDSIMLDGYYVDVSGVWDGSPSAKTEQDNKNLGPGVVNQRHIASIFTSGRHPMLLE